MNISTIPEKYRLDIEKATFCLKEEGCTAVFLFGSLATGKYTGSSDIDLGIMGLPPRKYIRTCSKLSNIMENEFDLVDFDENKALFDLLHSVGEIVKIG
jgi:predicted nucleotidyltransferase